MTEQNRAVSLRAARDEKLRAIAHVFGDAVAARLRAAPAADAAAATDASQLAWQTNRLIQHLRDRTSFGGAKPSPTSPESATKNAQKEAAAQQPRDNAPDPTRTPGRKRFGIPTLAIGEDLAGEHPAVIAHVLRTEPQHIRVSVLRALPGHVSRAVMRRLRDT